MISVEVEGIGIDEDFSKEYSELAVLSALALL
jgi:hypothetical protein